MSLLLEALKKAELAKQGGQSSDPATSAAEPRSEPGLSLEMVERAEPVMTRERLPDISQSLEISTEDLGERSTPPAARPAPVPPPASAAPAPEPRAAAPEPPPQAAQEETAARDAARQMFEVKEVDYNPRRPFYITVAVLILFGVGYGVYVWWQMQPHYTVNTAAVANAPKAPPPAPAGATPPQVAAPQTTPAVPTPPTAPTSSAAPPQAAQASATPTGTGAAAAPAPSGASSASTAPATRPSPQPRAARQAASATPSAPVSRQSGTGPAEGVPISITPSVARPDPALESAYSAFQAGNLERAREQYERLLEREPQNRDALLGLAAIDVRTRNFETAELRYLRLIELNPRDTYAQAGLIALQGSVDPVQSESRVKTLLAGQPEAIHLYFILGNQYAAQGRWAEAQDAYFKAYSSDPQNPDYAYNLAVSLDQLRQRKIALEYYRKALALAAQRSAAFDRARAETRAQELAR